MNAMRKSLLTIACQLLLATQAVRAQTLTVKQFTADGTDITASTQRRLTSNGKPCALVKVQMADRIESLEGDMNVGNMPRTGTTTLVYLPDETYGISLRTQQHGIVDINFSDYGVENLKSLTTYVLVLTEGTAADPNNPTDAHAQYELGLDYKMPRHGKERDATKALEWFMKAAEQGLAEAQLEVGRHYVGNFTPEVEDSAMAISWLRKAAEQGLVDAQYELADYYFNLWVFLEDTENELHPYRFNRHQWLIKAAENGSVKAMVDLGKFYPSDDNMYWDFDIMERMKWNEKASNKGSADAAFNQGQIYEYVYKDLTTAKQWYQKASRRGHEKARDKLNQIDFK